MTNTPLRPVPSAVTLGFFLLVATPAAAQPAQADDPAATRDKLLREGGGNAQSEAAVAAGLAWLARQQQKDGSWKFDAASKEQVAATGLALLPFLAAGEGPTEAKKYRETVKKGIDWLAAKVQKDGKLADLMYSQAIGTIALCDAHALSKDGKLKETATAAVGYIVKAQAKNGSWGYRAGTDGDTSILGWQVQALTAARLGGIPFEKDKVYGQADKFLESVSRGGGAFYGYREKGKSKSLTPVGLLSRYAMATMPVPLIGVRLEQGVDFLKESPPRKEHWDMYYYYYATRTVHLRGGDDWKKAWNPKMRDLLIDLQDKAADEYTKGSWPKDDGFIGGACGRLGTTALALLTLEVYYRYPTLKADPGLRGPGK